MPAYQTPQQAVPGRAPADREASPAPAAAEGSPEWLNAYSLSAGNAATLSLIAGGVQTDESTANGLLDGTTDLATGDTATKGTAPATKGDAPAVDPAAKGDAPAVDPATPSKRPTGVLAGVYDKNTKETTAMHLTLTASQKNELAVFRANWDKNHARYEAVASQTGVPAKLIAAIHYREGSMRWDTYLHQGDPLGKKAVHHPSNIPIFYKWEDAAVHALNMKKGTRDAMGMDESTDDPQALATYAEAYNGLGYYNKGRTSAYVYSGTDQYKGGRYVADGVYDPRSVNQRVGVMALMGGLDGADLGAAPRGQGQNAKDAWALITEGKETLQVGSSGEGVKVLQEKLTKAGFPVKADSSFGGATLAAVKAFQTARGLPADGKVSKNTALVLDGGVAPAPGAEPEKPRNPEWPRVLAGGLPVMRGAHGDHVTMIQEFLTKHGFPVDAIGTFGPITEKQVKAFQKANGLPVDGIVGRHTALALQA